MGDCGQVNDFVRFATFRREMGLSARLRRLFLPQSQEIPCHCPHFLGKCRKFALPPPSPKRAGGLRLCKIDSNRKAVSRDYLRIGGTCPSCRGLFKGSVFPISGGGNGNRRASMARRISSMGGLRALLAAIRSSPIIVRLGARLLSASEWARIRNSPEVDAYVLAWIASHVREPRRGPRTFM
jgi:hypothetical protein